MSKQAQAEVGALLTQQLGNIAPDLERMQHPFARADRLAEQLDDAYARISNACLLVDEVLDHMPEECTCKGDSKPCVWHRLDDALRGAA